MTINIKKVLMFGGVAVAMFLTALAIVYAPQAFAGITYNGPTQAEKPTFTNHTFFSATTTTATSTNAALPPDRTVRIDGADKATFYFSHGGTATTSTGGSVFTVEVSPDGSSWYDFNKLIGPDVASTATSSVTLQGATTTQMYSMNLDRDTYRFARCISTELSAPLGVDGEQGCSVSVEYK